MKSQKIFYWVATGLFSAMMLMASLSYFTSPEAQAGFVHLGFPDYFRLELGSAKFLGVIALLIPAIPGRIKEWAYAGFSITVISAFIAHQSVGDPAAKWMMPVIAFVILITSYIFYHKLQTGKK
jgi:hypothetical protein